MFRRFHYKVRGLPAPLAGLALGIASLGVSLEHALPLGGWGRLTAAFLALTILLFLGIRFLTHFDTLVADLKHPVVGAIIPTFAMCLMVLSKTLAVFSEPAGTALWGLGLVLHVTALLVFVRNRLKEPRLVLMVPSWFVPPVGLVVAALTVPAVPALLPLVTGIFWFGAVSYAILLPTLIYRLVFLPAVPEAARPTIAMLAAPANILLAAHLTISPEPSLMAALALFAVALPMTMFIYFTFLRLVRMKFTPGYAAFTFPMVIGATALYKLADFLASRPDVLQYAEQVRLIAHFEVTVATAVTLYVGLLYIRHLPGLLSKPAAH